MGCGSIKITLRRLCMVRLAGVVLAQRFLFRHTCCFHPSKNWFWVDKSFFSTVREFYASRNILALDLFFTALFLLLPKKLKWGNSNDLVSAFFIPFVWSTYKASSLEVHQVRPSRKLLDFWSGAWVFGNFCFCHCHLIWSWVCAIIFLFCFRYFNGSESSSSRIMTCWSRIHLYHSNCWWFLTGSSSLSARGLMTTKLNITR